MLDLRRRDLNPMYWPARRQETLLTTAIYKFHPEFANAEFEIWYGDPDKDHGSSTWKAAT